MAQIDIGKLKPTWKSAYNNSTAYVVDDMVSYQNQSYICKLASTGNVPTNTTYWDLIAAKGSDGTDADLAAISGTVQGDLYYNNGSAIARLAPGTSGQFLKTLGGSANPAWGDVSSGLDSLYVTNETTGNVSANTSTQWTSWETPLKNDFGSAWNSTNGTFTIPTTGSYFVHCYMAFGHNGNSTGYHKALVYVDGSEPASTANGYLSTLTRITSTSIQDTGYDFASGIVTLNANQVLTFYIYLNDQGASSDNHLNKARLTIMKL